MRPKASGSRILLLLPGLGLNGSLGDPKAEDSKRRLRLHRQIFRGTLDRPPQLVKRVRGLLGRQAV